MSFDDLWDALVGMRLFSAKLILITVRVHFEQDVQAFTETLIMNYLTLTQEAEGSKILFAIR